MKALRLPSRVSTVAYLVRFRRPRFTPSVRVSPRRSRKIGGLSQARALGQPAPQFSGSSLRGHGWVLSGLQAIHPVPLLRSWTPVESACPRQSGHSMLPPRSGRRGLRHWLISRLTPAALAPALLRFALPLLSRARLASGWLTGLYREGVEPSGPRWKVSARIHDHPPSLSS